MERPRINIGVLTSSRADYGIYLPLLKKMREDKAIEFFFNCFWYTSKKDFGYTVEQIEMDGFNIDKRLDCLKIWGYTPEDIAQNYAYTGSMFAKYWGKLLLIWFLCLGDRFEMAAAVNAGIPHGISFAHSHAGESSQGAIDNIYRDQISLASELHFVSINALQDRIEKLTGKMKTAFYCGAIGLENIQSIQLLSIEEFKAKWNIDLSIPTILLTVHPETIQPERNKNYIKELEKVLRELLDETQVLATMPNVDTLGSWYRKMFDDMKGIDNLKLLKILEHSLTLAQWNIVHFCWVTLLVEL